MLVALDDPDMLAAASGDNRRVRVQAVVFDIGGVLELVGTLNHDLATFFADLRPRYRTGILSNSFVGAREREQALYGFEDVCDVIVYSDEVGWLKPDPRIYHAVCEQLRCAPEEAVLVDDVPANIDGARAVGMHGVLFTDTAQTIADLKSLMC